MSEAVVQRLIDELATLKRRVAQLEQAEIVGKAGVADVAGDADTVDGIHAAASATANKLLALNAGSKLPASITGDADTVDTLHAAASGADAHVLATDASGNARVDGQFRITTYCKRGVFVKTLSDASATSVFRVSIPDAANDGGDWVCTVRILVANGRTTTTGAASCKGMLVQFARAMVAAGTGICSAVTEICETASAATTAATRDLGAITVTTTETSEFDIDVQITADGTGSGAVDLIAVCSVELLYVGVEPTLSQL